MAVIHEHLDVIKDAIAEGLGFIDGKEQGLVLVSVQVGGYLYINFLFDVFIRN